jgi:hypothetical protein
MPASKKIVSLYFHLRLVFCIEEQKVVWIETELNAPFEHINISNSNNCMYFLAHFTLHQLTVHDFRMSLVNLNSKWPAARAIHKGARLIFVCDKHIPGSNNERLSARRLGARRENFFEFAFCLLLCILFIALSFALLFALCAAGCFSRYQPNPI